MGLKSLFIALAVADLIVVPVKADEVAGSSVDSSISIDLVSGYIWRGQDMGGVSIQPGAAVAWRGFSLGAWGSSSFEKEDVKEVDIIVGYSWKGLNVSITDYWFDNGPGYFRYKAHNTAHVFEGHVGYDFGPAALNWYTNFAGNDGVTSKGKRAYSSYLEVSAPFALGGIDWNCEVGASPWATGFYNASGFAVINVGLKAAKDFKLSDTCGLTLFVKGICDPRDDKGYILAGISFAAF